MYEVASVDVGGGRARASAPECPFDGRGEYVPRACRPAGAGASKGEQRAANKLALHETQVVARQGFWAALI